MKENSRLQWCEQVKPSLFVTRKPLEHLQQSRKVRMARSRASCLGRERKDKAVRPGHSLLKHAVPLCLLQSPLSSVSSLNDKDRLFRVLLSRSLFLCGGTTTIPSVHLARVRDHSSLCCEKMHKSWLRRISSPLKTKQRIRPSDQGKSSATTGKYFLFISTSPGQVRCVGFPRTSTVGAAISTSTEHPASSLFTCLQAVLQSDSLSNMSAQPAWVTPFIPPLSHPRPPQPAAAFSPLKMPPASKPAYAHDAKPY
jgi:hypothetical protein